MRTYIKDFSNFINESSFHHRLPNNASMGSAKLRDEFRELSPEEKQNFQQLADELDEMGLLDKFSQGLSKYMSIQDVYAAMQSAISHSSSRNMYGSFKDSNYWVSKDDDTVYDGDFDDYEDEEHSDWDSLHSKYGKNAWFGSKDSFDAHQQHSKGAPFVVRRSI